MKKGPIKLADNTKFRLVQQEDKFTKITLGKPNLLEEKNEMI